MGSITRTAGGIGAAVLAGAALTMAQAPAQAAAKKQVVTVPCSSAALAAAITAANATPATLRLAANCTYDITTAATAADALPIITGNVRLIGGPSTTIRRNVAAGAVRLLEVATTGTLRIDGIFLLNGTSATSGGAIMNAGSLTLNQVTLSGNTAATNGGGVDIAVGGRALIFRTIVSANTALAGSGGGVNNNGTLRFEQSRASANSAVSAGTGGGGINTALAATSSVIQSTLDHNTTTGSGGGIRNLGTTLVDHTLIELNAATLSGGGIFNLPPGTVTIFTSIIRNNTPTNCFPLNSIAGCTN
ncbi:hypothetical protein GCM10027176_56220 [Actinoallomurus bryophytorum]|uniref:Outer membrane repeat protein n=1 Tax=Actinoallomurus bryophytorum TaxID=1490222 RepID=A0A543C0C6_9ACTN|nr:hypothetical protein [Actinoallomurus bryophytorum]TQL90530.1 hypothetical protein FB559_7836 [Actinoallomurus bryophytorum]